MLNVLHTDRVSAFFLDENLPFQNHLSVPDTPTSTNDVTRGATSVCFRFIKIKSVWIGLVIYLLVDDL